MRELPIALKNEGDNIVALLKLPEQDTKRAVVLAHGFMGDKNGPDRIFVRLAEKLAEAGIATLRFDFRGSGESDGRFVDMTVASEVSDLKKAIAFVRARGYESVGLLGESLGGAVAAMACDSSVGCMVLWYPVIYPKETAVFKMLTDHKKDLDKRGFITIENDEQTFKVGRSFYEEIARLDVAKHVRSIRCPLLVITGTADKSVPSEQSEHAVALAGVPKELKMIEGAKHSFSGTRAEKWRSEAIDATVEWFDKWLK